MVACRCSRRNHKGHRVWSVCSSFSRHLYTFPPDPCCVLGRLGIPLSRRRGVVILLVLLSSAVWPSESWRWLLSSVNFSAVLFPASRSATVDLPKNRRCISPDELDVEAPASLLLNDVGIKRLRGSGEEPSEVSGGDVCPKVETSREAVRKPFTSVMALDGVRRRPASSSSSFIARRVRRSDVLRPSCGGSSGSSVTALRFLSIRDDLLPVTSSGSSVPALKVLRSIDDFRPALPDSSGVSGAAANRGLDKFDVASIVILLCSRLVGARGLVVSSLVVDTAESGKATDRFCKEELAGFAVGLFVSSASRAGCCDCDDCTCLGWLNSSASAMHSSVKLLQILSAFRRNCRSVTLPPPPTVLAPLEIGPGCPGIPIMLERARASVAADSMALKTSGLTRFLVFERAE